MGEKYATLYVRIRRAQGQVEQVRVQVSANAADYLFHTLPGLCEPAGSRR
jgi:hypothetical protein